MKLRKKITLGFTLVIVLLLIVSLLAVKALKQTSGGFTNYRELARDTNLSGRLQANMLNACLSVKNHIQSGKDEDFQNYEDYWTKMTDFMKQAHNDINNPERSAKIKKANANLENSTVVLKELLILRKSVTVLFLKY